MAPLTIHSPVTLAQLNGAQISWHRSRARFWEGQVLSPFAAGQIAHHRQQIAQLEQVTAAQGVA
jgi:hypothetical protein